MVFLHHFTLLLICRIFGGETMNSSKLTKLINEDREYLFQNYGDRLPAAFIRGDGSYLYDQDNKRYVDLFSGIAVSSLGHANQTFLKALHGQVDRIIHTSNLFLNPEQIEAAKLVSETSFPGKTLFVNSGTEANEAAIKLARRYGLSVSPKKYRIVTFTGSFHGRTFGSMSATAQEKIHKGFGPIVPGFIYVEYNNRKAFKKVMKKHKQIAAVMFELIQGEGGINVADQDFVRDIFEQCNQNGVLTIVDEVQTGIARTGKTFVHQHYGITPDILTLAKGLGGGVAVGALHAKTFLSEHFPKGSARYNFRRKPSCLLCCCCRTQRDKKEAVPHRRNELVGIYFQQAQEDQAEDIVHTRHQGHGASDRSRGCGTGRAAG